MKRALVSLLGAGTALAVLFMVSFYAGGYRLPRRTLAQALGDHLFMIRSYVLEGMGGHPAQAAGEVEGALSRLDPRCHYEVRDLAAWRLDHLKPLAEPVVRGELAGAGAHEPDAPEGPFRLRAVVGAAASLRMTSAVPELLGLLAFSRDRLLRLDVLRALGEIGDPRGIPALAERLRAGAPDEREAALGSLARIGGEATPIVLGEAARSMDPRHLEEMCWPLGLTRDPRAAELLVALARHPRRSVRQAAVAALDQVVGKAAIRPVVEAIEREENDFVRARLISDVLDDMDAQDPLALDLLRRLAGDPILGERAVQALGRSGSADALDILVSTPKGSDPLWVMGQLQFSGGLPNLIGPGATGQPATLALLTRYLDHPEARVRDEALDHLVTNGDPGALPAVEKLLADPDRNLRVQAGNAALALSQWAALDGLLQLVPSADARREIRSEFRGQYVIGFAGGFLVTARTVHRVALAISALLGAALLLGAVRVFEPYRFSLLPLLLLFEGFTGDLWWTGGHRFLGRLFGDDRSAFEQGVAAHLLLLLGWVLMRPDREPGALPSRFARLGGWSLWLVVPGVLYFGTPLLAEASRKAAASGPVLLAFGGLFVLAAFLTTEEYLVPWSLFPRTARTERVLIGVLSSGLMLLLAHALGRLGEEHWRSGDADAATLCGLMALPLLVAAALHAVRAWPRGVRLEPVAPLPPGSRLKVRQDGETLSVQMPGARLQPAYRIQIRRGFVRGAYVWLGAGLFAGSWSRRAAVREWASDLTDPEKAWLRARLGHDPTASAEALVRGLKLELHPQWGSRSPGRLRAGLRLTHHGDRPWSLADLEAAAGAPVWKATVNGMASDVCFSQEERERAIPPRRATLLQARIYPPEEVPAAARIEVALHCHAAGDVSSALAASGER